MGLKNSPAATWPPPSIPKRCKHRIGRSSGFCSMSSVIANYCLRRCKTISRKRMPLLCSITIRLLPHYADRSDWAELGVLLDEFGHRKLLLEEVQNNLTKEDATFMLNHNPAFAALRRSLRPERALAVMKDSLAYMFMRGSHDEINAMVLSQRANHHIRDRSEER